jgi:uridylate kinase
MYSRVLLKLSGEAISASDFPFSVDTLNDVALQIKQISEMGVKVGIVVGGGNICRGRIFEELGFDRIKSDYTGMFATVINAVMLENALNRVGCKAIAMSVIKAQNVEDFSVERANEMLDKGYVVIFGGGYGEPYYSTDSGAAQKAIDINAEVILMAKSGVDGIYDSDPNTNKNAVRYDEITYQRILDDNLKVIDSQAAQMCVKSGIPGFVFNMNDENNIVKAVKGETIGTIIK